MRMEVEDFWDNRDDMWLIYNAYSYGGPGNGM